MPALDGSHIDPRSAGGVTGRENVHKRGKKKELEVLLNSLAKWRSYKSTRAGVITCELADPMIEVFKSRVTTPIGELRKLLNSEGLSNMMSEDIKEYRAECRGALKVWQDIKFKSEELERRLEELKKLEAIEEKEMDKRQVEEPELPEAVEVYA